MKQIKGYNRTMKQQENRLDRVWAWVLSLGGMAGVVAMTWQASERISMLKNPTAPLNCNLNPVIDCGSVLNDRLAALFGFPNAFIGMIVFAMLMLSGLFMLGGTKPNRTYRLIVMLLATVLMGFSAWFFGVSLYVIGKICIFCLVGWLASVPIFVYSLHSWLGDAKKSWLVRARSFITKNHLGIIIATYLIMLAMYLMKFQDYYFN